MQQLEGLLPHVRQLTNLVFDSKYTGKNCAIPGTISCLVTLAELSAHSSSITTLPEKLLALTCLTRLSVQAESFTLHTSRFSQLSALTHVSLDCKELTVEGCLVAMCRHMPHLAHANLVVQGTYQRIV